MEEWRSGRVEEWRSGGVEEWRSGGVEEWRSGGVEEWRSGRVEEWRSGRVEEWRSGRVEVEFQRIQYYLPDIQKYLQRDMCGFNWNQHYCLINTALRFNINLFCSIAVPSRSCGLTSLQYRIPPAKQNLNSNQMAGPAMEGSLM